MGARLRLVKSNEPEPKKRFGQHFLRDTGVIDRIVRWIQPVPDDVFLEIGAGDGALSRALAPGVSRLLAVELDRDCIPRLESALAPFTSAILIHGDILQLDLEELVVPHLPEGQKLRVAGNLPYNISTAVITQLLHAGLQIEDMSFMVQFEVARRILAKPGSRDYGFLSVHCQHHSVARMGFKVSPACFVPRPKVSSATISLRPGSSLLSSSIEGDFEELAKAAFSYRRKTLANSLAQHRQFGPISSALLDRAGIDGARRAEDLSVQEYEHLAVVYRDHFA